MTKYYCLIIIVAAIYVSGCVSSGKYNQLLSEHRVLKEKYNALSTTSDYYYNEGIYCMKSEKYDAAMINFTYLIEQYPQSNLSDEAKVNVEKIRNRSIKNLALINEYLQDKSLYDKLNFIEGVFNEYYLYEEEKGIVNNKIVELRVEYEKEKYVKVRDDNIQSCRFIETLRDCAIKKDKKKFTVELYIIENYDGDKNFRIITKYTGDEWVFYEKITLVGSNNILLEINCPAHDKETKEYNGKYIERYDYPVEGAPENIIQLAEAENIKVSFKGNNVFTLEMSEESLRAFKEIAARF